MPGGKGEEVMAESSMESLSDAEKTAVIHMALSRETMNLVDASELEFPMPGGFAGRRIDYWALATSASKDFRATAYEIKVSRSDFKRDSDEKQAHALRYSDRFWYVTPPGLLTKADLPEWAGLMELHGKRLKIIRKAPMREKSEPTWGLVVSIVRNSTRVRRDTDLLSKQMSELRCQNQRLRDELDRQSNRRTRQMIARSDPIAAREWWAKQ